MFCSVCSDTGVTMLGYPCSFCYQAPAATSKTQLRILEVRYPMPSLPGMREPRHPDNDPDCTLCGGTGATPAGRRCDECGGWGGAAVEPLPRCEQLAALQAFVEETQARAARLSCIPLSLLLGTAPSGFDTCLLSAEERWRFASYRERPVAETPPPQPIRGSTGGMRLGDNGPRGEVVIEGTSHETGDGLTSYAVQSEHGIVYRYKGF